MSILLGLWSFVIVYYLNRSLPFYHDVCFYDARERSGFIICVIYNLVYYIKIYIFEAESSLLAAAWVTIF